MNLRRLFCRHADCLNARNDDNQLVRRCTDCGTDFPILAQEVNLDGPAHVQRPDLGACRLKAQRVRSVPEFVARFERKTR